MAEISKIVGTLELHDGKLQLYDANGSLLGELKTATDGNGKGLVFNSFNSIGGYGGFFGFEVTVIKLTSMVIKAIYTKEYMAKL